MAENRRGKDGRFYFSRGQMVLLGAAFTAALLIIFVLGVFVGKGIEGRKLLKKEEPLVKIPIKPGAAESTPAPAPAAKNEITFNESLPKQAAAAIAPDEPRAAARTAEKVVKAEAKDGAAVKSEAPPVTKIAEKKSEKPAPTEASAKKVETVDSTDGKDAGKIWRAQVNAFPDERSAKQIVDRLKNKGYNAYVTEVQNRGKSWYRVSVGKYNSRDEADKMVEALRTKENYPKAFAASR
jgi:cell division septation protein DedD